MSSNNNSSNNNNDDDDDNCNNILRNDRGDVDVSSTLTDMQAQLHHLMEGERKLTSTVVQMAEGQKQLMDIIGNLTSKVDNNSNDDNSLRNDRGDVDDESTSADIQAQLRQLMDGQNQMMDMIDNLTSKVEAKVGGEGSNNLSSTLALHTPSHDTTVHPHTAECVSPSTGGQDDPDSPSALAMVEAPSASSALTTVEAPSPMNFTAESGASIGTSQQIRTIQSGAANAGTIMPGGTNVLKVQRGGTNIQHANNHYATNIFVVVNDGHGDEVIAQIRQIVENSNGRSDESIAQIGQMVENN